MGDSTRIIHKFGLKPKAGIRFKSEDRLGTGTIRIWEVLKVIDKVGEKYEVEARLIKVIEKP